MVQIGENGQIIENENDYSDSGTIIREDGTIESSSIENVSNSRTTNQLYPAPVSPFEENASVTSEQLNMPPTTGIEQPSRETPEMNKSLADLEYDLMVMESHVRAAMSIAPIVALVIMLICGITIHPVFYIGFVVAGLITLSGLSKKSSYEEQARHLKNEIILFKQKNHIS